MEDTGEDSGSQGEAEWEATELVSCSLEPRENEGTEREAPGPALVICHVHESYF